MSGVRDHRRRMPEDAREKLEFGDGVWHERARRGERGNGDGVTVYFACLSCSTILTTNILRDGVLLPQEQRAEEGGGVREATRR